MKKRIFEIISPAAKDDSYSRIFDMLVVGIIILNVIGIGITTFNHSSDFLYTLTESIELVSVMIFTIEYLLRVWTGDLLYPKSGKIMSRIKYIVSFMAIIDLVSILPFYLPFFIDLDARFLDTLRILRLLRIFKLHRYTNALTSMHKVIKRKGKLLISSVSVILLLTIITAIVIYNIESEAQPEVFENAFSGLWWAVATFTTVGYGDIVPITVPGKLFSSFIAYLGLGLIAIPTGIISAGFVELDNERHEREILKIQAELEKEENEKKCFCPYCGKNIE